MLGWPFIIFLHIAFCFFSVPPLSLCELWVSLPLWVFILMMRMIMQMREKCINLSSQWETPLWLASTNHPIHLRVFFSNLYFFSSPHTEMCLSHMPHPSLSSTAFLFYVNIFSYTHHLNIHPHLPRQHHCIWMQIQTYWSTQEKS